MFKMFHNVHHFLIFCCWSALVLGQSDGDYTVVNTRIGQIRGKVLTLTNGLQVAAFLGIPFAEPPVGPLRFKAPVPKAAFKEVFNATTVGPFCSQSKHVSLFDIVTEPSGQKVLRTSGLWEHGHSEDCLHLNVYVPLKALPDPSSSSNRLPIMCFIPGGSFLNGGNQLYPGEWLASAGEVIVVTVNYRLGVLGFLSTQDETAKGNYGLLDQTLALKWIRDNIDDFGGNPKVVTLFGQSAGAACVGLHLISPMSRGLFSKAILQSGSPIAEWAVQKEPRMYAEKLAKKLNCPDGNDSSFMLECLRKISAEKIIENSDDAKSLEEKLILEFAPVVDGEFLLEHPSTMLQQESSLVSVPVIVGVTRDEFDVFMGLFYHDKGTSPTSFIKDLLRKYLLPVMGSDFKSDTTIDVLLHTIHTEYAFRQGTTSNHKKKRKEQQKLNNSTLPYHENLTSVFSDIRTLSRIFGDFGFKAPSVKLVDVLALHPNASVYMYEFDYKTSDDPLVSKYVGSYHGSELNYILGFPHMNLSNALRLPQDREVSDIMIQLWTDFAKTNNPTPRTREVENAVRNFTWTPYTEHGGYFAILGLQPFTARSYETEKMTFWNHFIPLFTEYPIFITSNQTKDSTEKHCADNVFAYVGWLLFFIFFPCLVTLMYLNNKIKNF